ncbi:AraC-type DNA-binding protein [Amycolatopsis xylanica]|uniref:AraC-type DNA-binding protein n=1 Tax=Amycolatopsis xylanica TaxID=589385 RepID=A0A1H3KA86_9PSEU|nr:helix-turn-helix transcriptional regulator [Amycolatopsis xylanica]SDY49023.1 AraC-type DNA-binding protein [Amycolatopsis xylanica]
MVKSGHTSVLRLGFANPERPRLGIEVLDYATLRSRLSAELRNAVHRTDFHQLVLFTGGAGKTMVDFVDHPCTANTLLYVSPGRVLRLPRAATPRGKVNAVMVLFTAAFPPPLDRFAPLPDPFGPVVWTVPAEEDSRLRQAVLELKAEYERAAEDPETQAVTVELLRQLLGVLLLRVRRLPITDREARPAGSHDETFERFRRELERSFPTTRQAADYAARVGYSARSLNRLCLAATGQTAKALIDARVALEAKRLLVHTALPVATVGHRLGFTEPTNFGKFFAREVGMSPGAFRERG